MLQEMLLLNQKPHINLKNKRVKLEKLVAMTSAQCRIDVLFYGPKAYAKKLHIFLLWHFL